MARFALNDTVENNARGVQKQALKKLKSLEGARAKESPQVAAKALSLKKRGYTKRDLRVSGESPAHILTLGEGFRSTSQRTRSKQ